MRTLVICQSNHHFEWWCRENNRNPRDPKIYRLSSIEDAERTRGLRRGLEDVLVYYSWPDSWADRDAIDEAVKMWEL